MGALAFLTAYSLRGSTGGKTALASMSRSRLVPLRRGRAKRLGIEHSEVVTEAVQAAFGLERGELRSAESAFFARFFFPQIDSPYRDTMRLLMLQCGIPKRLEVISRNAIFYGLLRQRQMRLRCNPLDGLAFFVRAWRKIVLVPNPRYGSADDIRRLYEPA